MSSKPEHRRLYSWNGYQKRAKALTTAAALNPDTPCGRCGKTLDMHKPGAVWHAGHAWPNDPRAPLRAEVSSCNIAEANDRRHGNPHSETW